MPFIEYMNRSCANPEKLTGMGWTKNQRIFILPGVSLFSFYFVNLFNVNFSMGVGRSSSRSRSLFRVKQYLIHIVTKNPHVTKLMVRIFFSKRIHNDR